MSLFRFYNCLCLENLNYYFNVASNPFLVLCLEFNLALFVLSINDKLGSLFGGNGFHRNSDFLLMRA